MKILLLGLVFFCAYSLYTMELETTQPQKCKNRGALYKTYLKERKQQLLNYFYIKDFNNFKNTLGKIDVSKLTTSKKNPIFHKMVTMRGHLNFIDFLLQQNNVLVKKLDKKGKTPLFHALKLKATIQLLARYGADPPLFHALKLKATIQLLARYGADPNHKDHEGNSALHEVILQHGKLFHLQAIIETPYNSPINPMMRNRKGLTPLGVAYRCKAKRDILNFLEKFTLNYIDQDEECFLCLSKSQELSEDQKRLTLCCTQFICDACLGNAYSQCSNCPCCNYAKGKKPRLNLE